VKDFWQTPFNTNLGHSGTSGLGEILQKTGHFKQRYVVKIKGIGQILQKIGQILHLYSLLPNHFIAGATLV
jgi:hypothetical protein